MSENISTRSLPGEIGQGIHQLQIKYRYSRNIAERRTNCKNANWQKRQKEGEIFA